MKTISVSHGKEVLAVLIWTPELGIRCSGGGVIHPHQIWRNSAKAWDVSGRDGVDTPDGLG